MNELTDFPIMRDHLSVLWTWHGFVYSRDLHRLITPWKIDWVHFQPKTDLPFANGGTDDRVAIYDPDLLCDFWRDFIATDRYEEIALNWYE